jgi:hypothetical protein
VTRVSGRKGAGWRGLGCRVAALDNLLVSAPGVGVGGIAAPGVDNNVWCSIDAGCGRAGEAAVVVCIARLSSYPRHVLDEVLCQAADN